MPAFFFFFVASSARRRSARAGFIFREIVPLGYRLLLTSRPEAIDKDLYRRAFVILSLRPLDFEDQRRAIRQQVEHNEYFQKLAAFAEVRLKHDALYDAEVPEDLQETLEKLASPNRFFLAGGARDPRCRQTDAAGGVVARLDGAAASEQLRGLDTVAALLDCAAPSGEAFDARQAWAEETVAELEAEAAARRADMATLWTEIVAEMDAIYYVAERLRPHFKRALDDVADRLGLPRPRGADDDRVKIARLKKPVRAYAKAHDPREGYERDFDDGHPATACVVDVLRCMIVVDDARSLVAAYDLLRRNEVPGLELLRTKNKFGDKMGPTHSRNILTNVRVTAAGGGLSCVAEIQLHVAPIREWEVVSRAHDLYEYFRRELSNAGLGDNIEDFLDKTMSVYSRICDVPVRLSLLILILEGATSREMPQSIGDLYRLAVKTALRDYVDADGRAAGHETLSNIAVANFRAGGAGKRIFDDEILNAALGDDSTLSEMWEFMMMPDDRGGGAADHAPPLIKVIVSPDDSRDAPGPVPFARGGQFQFKHLSIQEYLVAEDLQRNLILGADDHGFFSYAEPAWSEFLRGKKMKNVLSIAADLESVSDLILGGRDVAVPRVPGDAPVFADEPPHLLILLAGCVRGPRTLHLAGHAELKTTLKLVANCVDLEELRAPNTSVCGTLRHLAKLEALRVVDLDATLVQSTLRPLASCAALVELRLGHTRIGKGPPRVRGAGATWVTVYADLTPLAGLAHLEILDLSHNSLQGSVAPLAKCPSPVFFSSSRAPHGRT